MSEIVYRNGARLDTPRGRARQKLNIEQSRERINQEKHIRLGLAQDNFQFVCWGDITELPLWPVRRGETK